MVYLSLLLNVRGIVTAHNTPQHSGGERGAKRSGGLGSPTSRPPAMSSAAKAKAKASGGKRGGAKDNAEALRSDKRRRDMDDSDPELDRCLAPLSLPTLFVPLFYIVRVPFARWFGSKRGS